VDLARIQSEAIPNHRLFAFIHLREQLIDLCSDRVRGLVILIVRRPRQGDWD